MGFKDLGLSYEHALHGVQSAIAYEMNAGLSQRTEPRHMRTGVDSAHITNAAIAELLIEKGIFTREEYMEKIRLVANHELAGYEKSNAPIKFR